METLEATILPLVIRALLIGGGALLLWAAPASVVGLLVMFVGLVFTVGGFTLEKTSHF